MRSYFITNFINSLVQPLKGLVMRRVGFVVHIHTRAAATRSFGANVEKLRRKVVNIES